MKLHELFPEISLNPASSKDIKQWILQLALNGKLTKEYSFQNPIQKNKISFSEFDIPKHWRIDFFNNICDFKMGKTPPSKEQVYWDGSIPWVSIADMKQNGIINGTKKTLSEQGFEYSFNKIACKKGTLLMSFKLTIGKTSILGIDACHNEAIISIYPKEFIYQRYLFWFLPILSNIGPQVSALMGNTLNKSKLEELVIPIPPLEEQQAIVTIVEDLFKEVDALAQKATERIALKRSYAQATLQRLCDVDTKSEWRQLVSVFPEIFNDKQTIKTLRETILQLAVEGKLTAKWRSKEGVHQTAHELLAQIKAEKAQLIKDKKIKAEKPLPAIEADEIPFELPEGWVWCRLGEVCETITKGSSPKWQGVNYVDESDGILFITSENVGNYHLILNNKKYVEPKFNEIEPRSILKMNDLLMNIVGGSIGRTAKYDLDDVANINQAVTIIRLINQSCLDYYLHFFNSPICLEYMFDKQVDNARPNLSMGNIAKFILPIPTIIEQQIIVEKVNALMGLCDELEKEVEGRENILQTI